MPNQPVINDGGIPSGSRNILFQNPDGTQFTLLAEDFSPNPEPIGFTDRKGIQTEFAGGVGRTEKASGSMNVQNVYSDGNPSTGYIVVVQPGAVFSEAISPGNGNAELAAVRNYVVMTAPAPDKNDSDKKQSLTFQEIANSAAFFVGGSATPVTFPITP